MTDTARQAVLELLSRRAPDATICPSEAARALARAAESPDWRARMPMVHAAVQQLVAEERVRLTWRGATRAVEDGPYRIGRPAPDG